MKKQNTFFYLLIIPFLASCSWTVPKSLSVKATDAEYQFKLGTVSKSLADKFTAESINSMISSATGSSSSESGTSSFNMSIYDYNPDNSDYYQYLIDIPFNKMEFDLSQIIPENLDFESTLGSSIQSPLEAQNITIPNLNEYLNKSMDIDIPDIGSKILENITFDIDDIPIVDFTDSTAELPLTPITVNIDTGSSDGQPNQIGQIEFGKGSLNITFTPRSNIPSAIETRIKILLSCTYDDGETYQEVSNSGDVILLPTTAGESATVHIPLENQTINTKLKLSFAESSFKGTGSGANYAYGVDVHFSGDASIHEITGVTMTLDQKLETSQTIDAINNDFVYSCTIGEGALYIMCPLPTGWSGIKLTPSLSLTGGINAATSDFVEIPSDNVHYNANSILNKKLILDHKTYSTNAITVNSSIGIALENATLIFDDNAKKLTITVDGNIQSIEEAIINLKSVLYDSSTGKSRLSYSMTYDLDSSGVKVSDYIYYITFLENTGLSIPYSNTLPEGNNITIKYYSDFFDFGSELSPKTETIYCFGNQTETVTNEDGSTSVVNKIGKLDIFTDGEQTIYPATDHIIDFTINMGLPGQNDLPDDLKSSEDAEYYGVLKNIEMGATYTIDIKSPKAAINWKEIGINKSVLGDNLSSTIDTGIDISALFSQFASTMGGSNILESIKLSEIEAFIYIVIPNFEAFQDLNLSGIMNAKTINKETSEVNTTIPLHNGAISTVTYIPELETDDKNVVIAVPDKTKATIYNNTLASLFNDRPEGSLNIEYALNIGDSDEYFIITREQFDALKNTASSEQSSTSIEIQARFTLPMKLNIDPSDGTDKVSLDIMKLINGENEQGDLFGRSSATSMDDIMKYTALVKSANLEYAFNNEILKYSDGTSNISIEFDPQIAGITPYVMNTGSGTIKITMSDFNKMMQTYPLKPVLKVVLPEGELQLPRKSEIGINAKVSVIADGTMTIFDESGFAFGGQ